MNRKKLSFAIFKTLFGLLLLSDGLVLTYFIATGHKFPKILEGSWWGTINYEPFWGWIGVLIKIIFGVALILLGWKDFKQRKNRD